MKKLICLFLFLAVTGLYGQIKQDLGNVHRQLYYKPGDWITFSATRYATGIAVGFKTAYIGTTGGVLRYDINKKHFDYPLTTGNGMLDNNVRVIALDNQTEYVWMATKNGLQFYNPHAELMTSATYLQMGFGMTESIVSIGFAQSKVWIETGKGFYSGGNFAISFFKEKTAPEETVWYGQRGLPKIKLPHIFTNQQSGFQFYDSESSFVDLDFRKFPVSYYAFDPFGNLWIATYGAGAWFARSVSYVAEPLAYGLAMESVTAMTFDNATMWLGGDIGPRSNGFDGENSALTEWNQETDELKYHFSGMRLGIRAQHTTAMIADSQNIWIGTEDGLIRKIKKIDYWSMYGAASGLFHPHIYSLASSVAGTLYIGTEHGLNYAVGTDNDYVINKIEIFELANVAIFKIRISEGTLWLGTSNGIYSMDERSRAWQHYNALGMAIGAKTLTNQPVRGIAEDASALYFASEWSVTRYDKKNKTWESIPVSTDFLRPGINDAVCDDRNLWIATNSGVLRYSKKNKKWIYYGVEDGLADGEVHVILADGDYVWFGTNRGVTQFYWNAPHLLDSE